MRDSWVYVHVYLETRYGRRPDLLPVRARRDFAVAILGGLGAGDDLAGYHARTLRMALDQLRIDNAWNALRARLRTRGEK